MRDHTGERRFAAAWWTPEDHRGRLVAFDASAQGASLGQEMSLPQNLIQRLWAHPRGEWARIGREVGRFGRVQRALRRRVLAHWPRLWRGWRLAKERCLLTRLVGSAHLRLPNLRTYDLERTSLPV